MRELICEFSNVFTTQVCNNLIDEFTTNAKYHVEGSYLKSPFMYTVNKNIKDSLELRFDCVKSQLLKDMLPTLSNVCIGYLNYLDIYLHASPYNHNIKHKWSVTDVKIEKYERGKGKRIYQFSPNLKKCMLCFIIFLNDVIDGGEIEFFGSFKIKPRQGSVIIFPYEWFITNSDKIPISNDKYIITGKLI